MSNTTYLFKSFDRKWQSRPTGKCSRLRISSIKEYEIPGSPTVCQLDLVGPAVLLHQPAYRDLLPFGCDLVLTSWREGEEPHFRVQLVRFGLILFDQDIFGKFNQTIQQRLLNTNAKFVSEKTGQITYFRNRLTIWHSSGITDKSELFKLKPDPLFIEHSFVSQTISGILLPLPNPDLQTGLVQSLLAMRLSSRESEDILGKIAGQGAWFLNPGREKVSLFFDLYWKSKFLVLGASKFKKQSITQAQIAQIETASETALEFVAWYESANTDILAKLGEVYRSSSYSLLARFISEELKEAVELLQLLESVQTNPEFQLDRLAAGKVDLASPAMQSQQLLVQSDVQKEILSLLSGFIKKSTVVFDRELSRSSTIEQIGDSPQLLWFKEYFVIFKQNPSLADSSEKSKVLIWKRDGSEPIRSVVIPGTIEAVNYNLGYRHEKSILRSVIKAGLDKKITYSWYLPLTEATVQEVYGKNGNFDDAFTALYTTTHDQEQSPIYTTFLSADSSKQLFTLYHRLHRDFISNTQILTSSLTAVRKSDGRVRSFDLVPFLADSAVSSRKKISCDIQWMIVHRKTIVMQVVNQYKLCLSEPHDEEDYQQGDRIRPDDSSWSDSVCLFDLNRGKLQMRTAWEEHASPDRGHVRFSPLMIDREFYILAVHVNGTRDGYRLLHLLGSKLTVRISKLQEPLLSAGVQVRLKQLDFTGPQKYARYIKRASLTQNKYSITYFRIN